MVETSARQMPGQLASGGRGWTSRRLPPPSLGRPFIYSNSSQRTTHAPPASPRRVAKNTGTGRDSPVQRPSLCPRPTGRGGRPEGGRGSHGPFRPSAVAPDATGASHTCRGPRDLPLNPPPHLPWSRPPPDWPQARRQRQSATPVLGPPVGDSSPVPMGCGGRGGAPSSRVTPGVSTRPASVSTASESVGEQTVHPGVAPPLIPGFTDR